ncbi:MAG: transcription antitermination factor NusB [Chromatiales bacterium]|jgi:N utilization substance protein B|nr:transcription antitermination factor NusB [Chromatiales bacterium]
MAATGRHGARRLLVQALYQAQVGGHDYHELLNQFAGDPGFEKIDGEYFRDLLKDILAARESLDATIGSRADRPVTQLDPVEHGILWLGTAELRLRPDVPPRVAIDEAVRLAREFGAQDSWRYVNAVLDQLAAEPR